MKLRELIKGLGTSGRTDLDTEINLVTADSRQVADGSVFVCIQGRHFDGHTAARQALEKGARAVVTQRPLGLKNELTVPDTRLAYALLCQNFFGNPQRRLRMIAVTGTNGKTTVSSIIRQALAGLGYKTGLIGTIHCEIRDVHVPTRFTTPEPWNLCSLFSRMLDASCTHVVMEASSQALDQGRLMGLEFDCAIFTNLTQDHLDYHGDLEQYYQAKRLLFEQAKQAVINIDDPFGRRLADEIAIPAITVSAKDDSADYTAKSIDYTISGVRFAINGTKFIDRIAFPMPGTYSVNNAMCAAAALFAMGMERPAACGAISQVKGVTGRCEVLYSGDFTVIRDYAHTEDGLRQMLCSLKPFVQGRMMVLFGCGGDRDAAKRPWMAQAVCQSADFVVLSSDNPRTEDPMAIIDAMVRVIEQSGRPYSVQPDRSGAIEWAIGQLKQGDVLILCGKGHEDYQMIDGCTIYLDESRVVKEVLNKKDGEKQEER